MPLSSNFTPSSPPDQTFMSMSNGQHPSVTPSHPQHSSRAHHRTSTDVKTNGHGTGFTNGNSGMPMPNGLQHPLPNIGSRHRGAASTGTFEGPRSPPNTKSNYSDYPTTRPQTLADALIEDTSHVPCKFFRSGQCQAGKACPFLHSTDDTTVDTPCKYFAKVRLVKPARCSRSLRRILGAYNYVQGNCKFGSKCALAHILPNGRRVNRPQLNLGGKVDPQLYQQSDPALAHSLLAQQANGAPLPFGHQLPIYPDYDLVPQQQLPIPENLPVIDTTYASHHADSKYGSPHDNIKNPISPSAHLSVLDAPMPASFDSQGISYIARHGAVAASVPSKFGLGSSPSSLPAKTTVPAEALRTLHSSAFGKDSRSKAPDFGSSPLGSGDEGFGQRNMHSKRVTKPGTLSASLPRPTHGADDWDDGFFFGGEEDFLPPSLHDLLTPQERMRRLSRNEQDSKSYRESLSAIGTPAEPSSKVNSPPTGSPSRYGALFARQKENEANNSTSAFGHVGSPLRNSSLHPLGSPSLRATKVSERDLSPSFASPPRQSSMSMISQQLARAKLSSQAAESSEGPTPTNNSSLLPSTARQPSTSSNLSSRVVSSGSIAGTGRIEEEQDGVFSMEEEEFDQRKRFSGSSWASTAAKSAPKPEAIGSGRTSGIGGKGYWG